MNIITVAIIIIIKITVCKNPCFITYDAPFEYLLLNFSKIILNFLKNLFGSLWLSFKNNAHSTGVNVRATKPDITTLITIVTANCLYITPVKPPINATGIKTADNTKTIAITGLVISCIEIMAASFAESFFSAIILSIFSITTIASSTTIPIANISPNNVN